MSSDHEMSTFSSEDEDFQAHSEYKRSMIYNKELRKVRNESLKLLDVFETEHRQDLGVHLYSSFLAHTRDPTYPPRKWTRWPMLFDQVPDPKEQNTYIDLDNYENPAEPTHDTKVRSEPLENLKIELNAYFTRSILNKISRANNGEPLVEFKIPKRIEAKVIQKVDEIVNEISKNGTLQLPATWTAVLLADRSDRSLDRCSRLFERYNYKFERSEESDEEVEEEEEEEEEESDIVPKYVQKYQRHLVKEMAKFERQKADSLQDDYDGRFNYELDPKVLEQKSVNGNMKWKEL